MFNVGELSLLNIQNSQYEYRKLSIFDIDSSQYSILRSLNVEYRDLILNIEHTNELFNINIQNSELLGLGGGSPSVGGVWGGGAPWFIYLVRDSVPQGAVYLSDIFKFMSYEKSYIQ